jgi:hypothetical protein
MALLTWKTFELCYLLKKMQIPFCRSVHELQVSLYPSNYENMNIYISLGNESKKLHDIFNYNSGTKTEHYPTRGNRR